MSDKGLARNLFPVRSPSSGRPSSLPDPSGLQRIPLTTGSVSGARSQASPLPDPSGLPRIPLIGGSVPGVGSSPFRDPSGLPCIPITGGSIPGSGSSPLPDPSGLPRNGFVSGARSSPLPDPDLSGLQHNPFLNGGNGIAYDYEMTGNNEDPTSDFFYNRPEHEHDPEHGHESVHEPESLMVQMPHYLGTHGGSNDADLNGSHRPFITRKGFGRQSIHRAILKIFWQSINEPWITYRKILKEVVTQMFEHFRTQYRLDPNKEGIIREGFENTLKDRYRGRMRDAREASKQLTGEDPSFIDHYYKTHLTAESKKIYFGGDKEAPVDFVNETSRVVIESYNKALFKKYGDDPTQHNVIDPELWTQTQMLRKCGKQKVNELRQQMSNMEQAMEEKQSEMNLQMQQMRNEMELQVQRQLAAFIKQINPSGNPPSSS
uniref:Uncharacterized protein n=1 Tax=Lactuca sativa TaxID=4236 RepID=A0A9R1WPA3_LACSA|nr:hypothetical protein LSAT_V11C100046090 [Lactuca sativa]